nr:hypothetical protein [Mycobacterium lepromatosis]
MSELVPTVPGVVVTIASVDDVQTMTAEVSCAIDRFTAADIRKHGFSEI